MLDEKLFDALPGKLKLAYALGMAEEVLGRELVAKVYKANRPLADDMVGHGPAYGARPAPEDNYWGGVWRVWEAE